MAENEVYTVQEVVDEIRCDSQIKRLAVLPYNLKVRQPDQESLRFVTEFAKKTGDFATLSLTDLTVVALTYQLEKELVGTEHLRTEPLIARTVFSADKPPELQDHLTMAGFYKPKNSKDGESDEDSDEDSGDDLEKVDEELEYNEDDEHENSGDESGNGTDDNAEAEKNATIANEELIKKFGTLGFNTVENKLADDLLQKVKNSDEESEEESEDEDSCEDDDNGWITPSNIGNIKKNFGVDILEDKCVEVACITTDFAMQNVLKQIGLHITALDGRVIKHMRTFILRCYSCYKTTGDVARIFCGKCGHKTLKRVAVSLDEKGEQMVHINSRRTLTAKYKNKPLPMPKGGKHACNPILFEDQPLPQQRISKKAQLKTDTQDDTYTTGYSPFVMRDVDSRSALMRNTANIKQWMNNYDYDNHRRGYKKYKK